MQSLFPRDTDLSFLHVTSDTRRAVVVHLDKVAQLRRAELKLREALDRDPTDEERAHDLQISPRSVGLYRQAARTPVSLDAPMGDDESQRIADTVADPNAAAPFDRLSQETDSRSFSPCRTGFDGASPPCSFVSEVEK